MQERCLRWLGHIHHMDESRTASAQQAHEWIPHYWKDNTRCRKITCNFLISFLRSPSNFSFWLALVVDSIYNQQQLQWCAMNYASQRTVNVAQNLIYHNISQLCFIFLCLHTANSSYLTYLTSMLQRANIKLLSIIYNACSWDVFNH